MSKYSGKCDVCDCYSAYSDDRLQKIKFFIGNTQLTINNQKDLMPYYPFIVAMSHGGEVHLSHCSYVDRHEAEVFEFYLDRAKKARRSLMSNKKAVDVENIMKRMSWNHEDYARELAKRVVEQGNKATWDGLTLPGITPVMRECLYADMVSEGYDEAFAKQWVYEKGNHYD